MISEVDQTEVEWNHAELDHHRLEASTLQLLRLIRQGRKYAEMRRQLHTIECALKRIEEKYKTSE